MKYNIKVVANKDADFSTHYFTVSSVEEVREKLDQLKVLHPQRDCSHVTHPFIDASYYLIKNDESEVVFDYYNYYTKKPLERISFSSMKDAEDYFKQNYTRVQFYDSPPKNEPKHKPFFCCKKPKQDPFDEEYGDLNMDNELSKFFRA